MLATISNRQLFVPDGDKWRQESMRIANALAIELLHYGIVADQDLVARISHHESPSARAIADRILKMYTIGDVNPPLFREWEERTEFTLGERVIQIFGYIVQLSGNDLEDPNYLSRLKERVEFKKLKQLEIANSKRAKARFERLVSSKVALDKQSQQDLVALAKVYHTIAPQRIQSAEVRIAVLLGMCESGIDLSSALELINAQPVDALRYAAAKREFESVRLPSDVLYAKLTWKERVQLLKFLAMTSFEDLCESMGNNREAWFRFFKHVHVFQQDDFRNRFTKVVAAAFVSVSSKLSAIPAGKVRSFVESQSEFYDTTDGGNLVFRTFASRVQSAVDAKDFIRFRAEIEKRPNHLMRNIGALSNVCTPETEGEFVDLVRKQIGIASASVLLSIIQIDTAADYRIIDSKGNTTVTDANYSPVIGEVLSVAEQELSRRYGLPGKVRVQEKLQTKVVPFLSTNAELDRGTRVGFEKSKYLYFLVHWIQKSGRRTDLDHSYVCFNAAWNAETIYFGNQANAYISQSGDITNAPAPNGGTEYGRIDLKKIPSKTRYIVPIINVYSGDVFSENETAYAGFMFSNDEVFSIQRKHVRYNLSQPANSNIPFVIDVRNQELLVVDFNNRRRNGLTAHSSVNEIRKIISALKTKRFMTIQRFAELLSGDADETSLTITTNAKKTGEIEPADLQSLIG